MKSMMKRNTFREIKKSFGRYFAILAIIALGVAFFSGLKITQSVMVHSADVYLKDLQFYDYRLVSTLGFTEENVEALAEKEDVRAAEGAISAEVLSVMWEGQHVKLTADLPVVEIDTGVGSKCFLPVEEQ